MNTPICDFVCRYIESAPLRLHMPGHKGKFLLGFEAYDITEIQGADSLFEANGIIRESEQNASTLFGAHTFYSTEGSSLCIRAMLYLAALHTRAEGKRPHILAGRNAHKTFLSAVALLDLDLTWLYPDASQSYLSCPVTAIQLECALRQDPSLTAVYLTSPDYLGNTVDIAALAEVCRRYDVLLLVDNAHGAYLKFLPESRHPIDLGAHLCCDSAHKTLPTLTGGAYLHISKSAPVMLQSHAKTALSLFASTSPSYLILQSLDMTNRYLAEDYPTRLKSFLPQAIALRHRLEKHGYTTQGDEPLKLTLAPKSYGYTGIELAQLLRKQNMECEFSDPDYIVIMLTPELTANRLDQLQAALLSLPRRSAITQAPPPLHRPERCLSVREATLSPHVTLPVEKCHDRILATATVGCPPAVPIIVCGERIDKETLRRFAYYGIDSCTVVAPAGAGRSLF